MSIDELNLLRAKRKNRFGRFESTDLVRTDRDPFINTCVYRSNGEDKDKYI